VGPGSTLQYRSERLSYVVCPWACVCGVGLVYIDDHDYTMMMHLLHSIAFYLECSRLRMHLYSCIIYIDDQDAPLFM
jgi:hypothetical protein